MNKNRIYFMDLARVISCFIIMYCHFFMTLSAYGIRSQEAVQVMYKTKNLHIGTVAVGIFFIISGMGLMTSMKSCEKLDIKKYFKKRFLRILTPFYVISILYFLFLYIKQRDTLLVLTDGVRPVSFILTILGLDGYLSLYGINTYYLGVGEWFIGVMVLCYILFPFLRWCLNKNKWISLAGATLYLIIIELLFDKVSFLSTVPGYQNFFVVIYEFFIGMFLTTVFDKIPSWSCFLVSIPILAFYFLYNNWLTGTGIFRIVLQNVSGFIFFMGLEPLLKKIPKIMKAIGIIGAASYEIFLVHHVVINWVPIYMMQRGIYFTNTRNLVILALIDFVLINIFAVIIHYILGLFSKRKKSI